MRSAIAPLVFYMFCCVSLPTVNADESSDKNRPIQALLVTGGCCHDYDRQKLILPRGVSARANVRWTIVHQGGTTTDTPIPLYDDPDWADGFDIVIHNECFSHVTDLDFVDRILQPHKDGLPAILIHCAMHCYRVEDDRWFKFVGLQSPGHGPHYSYTAANVKPDHPIMQGFGPMFVAPKGELYHSMKVFDTATPLAQANREADGMPQVCVWTNDYQGTKVFGCTMGHYNETMAEPKYLDMMAKAVLWAVGRDSEEDFTPSTEKIDEEIKALITIPVQKNATNPILPQNCCGDTNLAYGKPVTSKSEQSGNFRKHLTDGLLNTRYCPSGAQVDEWVTVDLEEPQHVRAIRLHWEKPTDIVYRYIVETSADNENWTRVVDDSNNEEPGAIRAHVLDAPDTQYIRTTFLGASKGLWGSIWELEVSAGELPELPEVVAPVGLSASIGDVQTPPGFNVTMFGQPPTVNYPVCLTAAATGEVFVGVDEQGSLGKETGRGKVLRCIDTNGDGTADQVNEFAKMDHPRGLIYDNGSLWVLHPPYLSVFRDNDSDGKSDESEVLIKGISTEEVNKRGADHTTNGIRMGIDGWIYIAVGDFGFTQAIAKDGTTLSKRGGGIVRIRPDGTEMEIYSWGQRNILDVAIDPYMNIFTRDNTNDGGGWDIRVSHILQSANYGYPSLYKNFTDEIMPPLADYGGGSGCGSMYFHDERWPAEYRNLLLTCDWGTSNVHSHKLPVNGATFDPQQDTFLKIPRPTDIDVDASGRMYVSSWKNGKFAYDGPDVGFVAQVTPTDFLAKPVPDVRQLEVTSLIDLLQHPSAAMRLHVQHEILRRSDTKKRATTEDDGPSPLNEELFTFAADPKTSLYGRAAAIFTLKQSLGARANYELLQLAKDAALTEYCLRAIADRKSELDGVTPGPFLDGLQNSNPRVQAVALIGLGRIMSHALANNFVVSDAEGNQTASEFVTSVATAILPLTIPAKISPEADGDDWRLPHPERVIPHLAVQALVKMHAGDDCIAALNTPYRNGALWALKSMHSERTINGLFKVLSTTHDKSLRREIWTTLIRLYHREGQFTDDGRGWWGTRPDTTGPYYDRQAWSESDRIAAAVKVALAENDESLAGHIKEQLKQHVVNIDGISAADIASMNEPESAIQLPKVDPNDPNQIANLPYETILSRATSAQGNADAGKVLFRNQSCISCHTIANGQQPKGPHLVDIGKRYKKKELLESIVAPSKKIAQGFDSWTFVMSSGKVHSGFVVLESAETVTIRQNDGLSAELLQDDIDERVKQEISMMPKGIVANLTPEQLADLVAWLQTLH
ncbi:MAG: ThuA domain-containing protein [Fuerstiella sp.]|nr:ThuA domain-containing protein [Fuerstiella sp.]